MTDLIINPTSKKVIEATIKKMPQSLLITGEKGVGISTISYYIADKCNAKPLILNPEKDDKADIKNGTIGVDAIRRLYDRTRGKVTKGRIIIIDYAETMTQQAQNAFLKLLEEPNTGTNFILVSHSSSTLLPTILSRVEKIEIKRITHEQTLDLLDSLSVKDTKKHTQLLFMADGLPAEIIRLVNDGEYFEKRSLAIKKARDFLQGTTYKKLLIVQDYKDDRVAALELLTDSANIFEKSLLSNPKAEFIYKIDKLLDTYNKIAQNGNIRLCLTQMIL